MQSDVGPASTTRAVPKSHILTLAAELEWRTKIVYANQLPDADAPDRLLKERLDQKRQELQEHLALVEELEQQLKVLDTTQPLAPNEIWARVLLIKGGPYDFTRLGRAEQRQQLDHILHLAAQIVAKHWQIRVIFGQPEIIEKDSQTWELTLDDLWRLGDDYASKGTPVLLFADRVLLPNKTLPHSWGRANQPIACVTRGEWLSEKQGHIIAHNLAHLMGLGDDRQTQNLMSHDEMGLQLSQAQIDQMRECVAERAAHWAQEHTAACQRGQKVLDMALPAVASLEQQGEKLWQHYQTRMEKNKKTPAHGVTSTPGFTSPAPEWSDLAYQIERLSQQVAHAEQELGTAKEMLTKVRSRLRAIATQTPGDEGQDG